MKRVASIVLNNFTSDSRVLKEGITLSREGYQVVVVALHDPGLAEKEDVNGIKVHRIKLITRWLPKSTFWNAFKYLEWLLKICIKYWHCDVFHCHDLNALPVGWLCTLWRGKKKLVYDAHEYETERSYIQGKIYHGLAVFVEKHLIRRCHAVITVSDSIAKAYAERYGIRKPFLVMNCPPLQRVDRQNIFRQRFGLEEDTTIFLYQGVLGRGRGVQAMIDAFNRLDSQDKAMVFMGYGPMEDLVKKAASEQPCIFFQQAVPFSEMQQYTASADWGMVYIEDVSPSYYYSLPNKLFEFMMAGVPVIATPLPEIAGVVNTFGVGKVLPDFTSEALAEIVRSSGPRQHPSFEQGIEAVRKQFNWENQEEVLKECYHGL